VRGGHTGKSALIFRVSPANNERASAAERPIALCREHSKDSGSMSNRRRNLMQKGKLAFCYRRAARARQCERVTRSSAPLDLFALGRNLFLQWPLAKC
jgi:hypothetical protein